MFDLDLKNAQDAMGMLRPGGVVTAFLILLLAYVLNAVWTSTLRRLGDRWTERRLFLHQVAAFSRFAIYFLAILLAFMSAVRLQRETVLALSGTAGIALGFAVKDLATSVLAGLTILIDKPFQVGDRIRLGDTYGEVLSIGLRSVRVNTLDHNLVTIPNSRLLTDIVSSGNAGQLSMLVQLDFFIGADQDAEKARMLVAEALTTSRYCSTAEPWAVLVNQVIQQEYFAIRMRAQAYVVDVRYEKAFETDITLRVLQAFKQGGIEPPARLTRMAG